MKLNFAANVANPFTKKTNTLAGTKQDAAVGASTDSLVMKANKGSFAKKLLIGVSLPVGAGLIAAATFGIMQFVPVASAGVHSLLQNPILIPVLIGVAAGAGAVFLGIALVKAIQFAQAKKAASAEAKSELKPSPSSVMLNHDWSESDLNHDGAEA